MNLAAPKHSGDVLAVPDFAAIPALVEENRQRLDKRFKELRALARQELNVSGPVIVTGHQPELFHPGVWAKNFAANGLARKLGGVAINLIVDTDNAKSASLRVPILSKEPANVRVESIPFDDVNGEMLFETRPILSASLFESFPQRLSAMTADWPFRPLGLDVWSKRDGTFGERLVTMRQSVEHRWGCENREVTVSRLSNYKSFRRFANRIIEDADRFRDVYNSAIRDYRQRHRLRSRNHPAAELEPGELPFWTIRNEQRRRTWQREVNLEELRPKALTLTLFCRLILGDFFIHGLGGGKYDEVTDNIVHHYFAIESPAFQILTATIHLPVNDSISRILNESSRLGRSRLWERRAHWNPQQFSPDPSAREHHASITKMSQQTRAERVARFHAFRSFAASLRESITPDIAEARVRSKRMKELDQALRNLTRRDYAWILYPEDQLKSFLQRFL